MILNNNPDKEELARLIEMLKNGEGIGVKSVDDKRILRIEWFNLIYSPSVVLTTSKLLSYWINRLGLFPDAISSIETSGTKFALVTSLLLNLPFFSIHKSEKVTFKKPKSTKSISITQDKEVSLVVDEEVVKKFKKVVLIDDIRRTSGTFMSAIDLLNSCGSSVEACFSILDFKFSSHEVPTKINNCRYYPLFIISEVYEGGKCEVEGGLALNYLSEKV
jgi:adenine/guanine phosphoribosyltransferase-like PRPP-binding protein